VILKWASQDEVHAGEHRTTRERYPSGYWYAKTDDGGFDGVGPDPLSAVSNLVAQLEAYRRDS
jgi:hypothetical protein